LFKVLREIKLDSYNQLLTEIAAINPTWHSMQDLFTNESPITTSLRDLKGRLQLRLLREFSDRVYLTIDPEARGEPQYSVQLKLPVMINVDGKQERLTNAMHLPVRIVEKWLNKGLIKESDVNLWTKQG
jgi:hypothetical protein